MRDADIAPVELPEQQHAEILNSKILPTSTALVDRRLPFRAPLNPDNLFVDSDGDGLAALTKRGVPGGRTQPDTCGPPATNPSTSLPRKESKP